MANVTFYLNGDAVVVEDPSPDLLLIDFLRSPEVGLAGPKKACGQGGCGACTVILSTWNGTAQQPEHRAINSCLRPVCSLNGLVVTTVEGTGEVIVPPSEHLHHSLASTRSAAPPGAPQPPHLAAAHARASTRRADVRRSVQAALANTTGRSLPVVKGVDGPSLGPGPQLQSGMNPVAHRLAVNNGSQCGYCSVGFVMNMSELLVNNPGATKADIEAALDGNLCRCTGYRPILTAMKTFASDWDAEDEGRRMKCVLDPDSSLQAPGSLYIPFPSAAAQAAEPFDSPDGDRAWQTPRTLDDLAALMRGRGDKKLRLVHGNTSFGVYPDEYWETNLFVDVRLIPELHAPPRIERDQLVVAAGTTYSDFIAAIEPAAHAQGDTSRLGAVLYMARRTAGRIVRNAASLGGNTMMVLRHIAEGTGSPFPSDLCTALVGVEATIAYALVGPDDLQRTTEPLSDLLAKVKDDPRLADQIVLIEYVIPFGPAGEITLSQKVALRDVNSHSIVNATTRFVINDDFTIKQAVLVFGGIAPLPWRDAATESLLAGGANVLDGLQRYALSVESNASQELARWAERLAPLPTEGFTDDYRTQLAAALFYKAIINALRARKAPLPDTVLSAGDMKWGAWGVSEGTQGWDAAPEAFKAPVAQPYIKSTAMDQCSGQQHYTHELAVPPQTVNAAFVLGTRALADYHFVVPGAATPATLDDLYAYLSSCFGDSFVDLITHEHIPHGGTNIQGMGGDQPLFAEERLSYAGQAIALVLADTEQDAILIARHVTKSCIAYRDVTWPAPFNTAAWTKPIVTIEQALAANSIYPDGPDTAFWNTHIWKITRPGSRFDWTTAKAPLDTTPVTRALTLDGVPCTVIENTQRNGGQAHFYMETQACIAEPADGGRMIIHSSTQSPMAQHGAAAMALGIPYHRIDVKIAPVGGGFGGKTEQTKFIVGPTAVAAHVVKRPVRLVMPREEDTAMVGKRHAYYGQYQVAIDQGTLRAEDKGIIRGMQTKMWGDGGAFYDCSFIVSNCIQMRADNAYHVTNFECQIDICRTNTAPSTAMRAFGDVQGKNIQESAIDDAAFAIDMLPEDVREKNLYQRGQVTPFGQALSSCYMREVWAYLKQQAGYDEKRSDVDAFNRGNRWRKRGLAMIPAKYGSGYNLVQLEQAAAFITVNHADGSVIVHQGGVEMGQGLVTQALQVSSYVLNVPMSLIHIENVSTSVMPNATSSGGSTGTPYTAEAVKQTALKLQARLMSFGYQMLKEHGQPWCHKQNIDFWTYPDTGWAHTIDDPHNPSTTTIVWQKLVALAYTNRVDLTCSFTAPIRGGEAPAPALTYKTYRNQPALPGVTPAAPFNGDLDSTVPGGQDSFVGFTYSAALAVVEVDILTGEVKIRSADIVYDMGRSMNPAIDIGQVEGAFMQGVGYLLTEKLVFEESGADAGRLNSLNTWTYKPPASTSVPLCMNVHLFPRSSVPWIPDDPNDIFSAKEVGEPPLVLANSVFFAVKAAVRASRVERGLSGLFHLDAPATVQEVRRACEVDSSALTGQLPRS
jgi:xanthine dehydrogenase/oxidase